jgi:hypothetical protein
MATLPQSTNGSTSAAAWPRRAYDRGLLDQWIANWEDIVDFEVLPVLTSAEVQERLDERS